MYPNPEIATSKDAKNASSELRTATNAEHEVGDHRNKINQNSFLREIYLDVYRRLLSEVPAKHFPRTLELGSGGGFLKELAPHIITSECEPISHVDRVVDACNITQSFGEEELDAIIAFDVFHHLPNAEAFLMGASEVLRPGGRIALVEPWFTPIGQWFYRAIHHEPYIMDPHNWAIVGTGRLEGANSRLPTSVFQDSDARFAHAFPELRIIKREPFHKWLYLFSGGLRLNTRVPKSIAKLLLRVDSTLTAWDRTLGIFAVIVVEKM